MISTFATLPKETQLQIFSNLKENTVDLLKCMLVCKSWLNPFQKLLYQRIEISSISQLTKLNDTLKKIEPSSLCIRRLDLSFQVERKAWNEDSIYRDVLYNLPYLEDISFFGRSWFKFLLDALMFDKLPRLTFIEPPVHTSDLYDYVACTIIIKERLTILAVVDPPTEINGVTTVPRRKKKCVSFHEHFSRLKTYKMLKTLRLKTTSGDEISLLEEATNNCPLLRSLELHFVPVDRLPNYSFTLKSITPAPNVKYLVCREVVLHNPQLTDYMIHKFSGLNTLILKGKPNRSFLLGEFRFKRLLTYLSKIRYVKIPFIFVQEGAMIDAIGEFWKVMAESHQVSVQFYYGNSTFSTNLMEVCIDKTTSLTAIRYPTMTSDTIHLDVIAKYGQFIKTLYVRNAPSSSGGLSTYETSVSQPLRCCPNLTRLRIVETTLGGPDVGGYILTRRVFDCLCIEACIIENETVFERLSLEFAFIEHLNLYASTYPNRGSDSSPTNIHMKETYIKNLSLSTKAIFPSSRRHYKLLVKLTRHYSIYHMCFTLSGNELVIEEMNNLMFDTARTRSKNYLIDLNFRSLDNLKIEHFGCKFDVPLPLLRRTIDPALGLY